MEENFSRPLESAISRHKLLQVARQELARGLGESRRPSVPDDDSTSDGESDSESEEELDHGKGSNREDRDGSDQEDGDDDDDNDDDDDGEEDEEDEEEDVDDAESENTEGTEDVEDAEEDEDGADIAIMLNRLNISTLPIAVIELLRKYATKLSLRENWLTALPLEFASMSRLSYLDISSNRLTELPEVLTKCSNLKILDISHNRLRTLPRNLGNLKKLMCISMLNNKFEYLPPSIVDMTELQILEIEDNPLIMPPKEVVKARPSSPEEQADWIESLKTYLAHNREKIYSILDRSREPSLQETSAWKPQQQSDFVLQPPPPPLSVHRNRNHSHSRSFEEHQNSNSNNNNSNTSTPPSPEGYRTDASSRAAKRMGFVVKKSHGTHTRDGIPQLQEEEVQEAFAKHVRQHSQENGRNDSEESGAAVRRDSNSSNHHHPLPGPTTAATTTATTSTTNSNTGTGHPASSLKAKSSSSTSIAKPRSRLNSFSEPLESVPGAYFRRLSTLPEEMRSSSQYELHNKIVESCRKVLFSLAEMHSAIRRCCALCDDQTLTAKLNSLLHTSMTTFPSLVSALEILEAPEEEKKDSGSGDEDDIKRVITTSVECLASFRNINSYIRTNLDRLTAYMDAKFVRSLILTAFQSFAELHNAWFTVYPTRATNRPRSKSNTANLPNTSLNSNIPASSLTSTTTSSSTSSSTTKLGAAMASTSSSSATVAGATSPGALNEVLRNGEAISVADDQLYERIYTAANAAQTVLGQLTQTISKSAVASAQGKSSAAMGPTVAAKLRDLTANCVTGVDVTRRLKTRMEAMEVSGNIDRKKFWDDLNSFLKVVIAILGSTKSAMDDVPILNEVRPNLATLTKVTKDITALIEYSSYNVLAEGSQLHSALKENQISHNASGLPPTPMQQVSLNSHVNSSVPQPTTPLVAALGPMAAQAVVLSPSLAPNGFSPFIPEGHEKS